MACIAYVCCVDVTRALARCGCTVVAGNTVTHKRGVINRSGRYPCRGAMTAVTLGGRWNMAGGFTGGNHVIVTARTGPQYLIVIHAQRCWCKWRWARRMTGFTHIRRIDMTYRFTHGNGIVMTAHAGTDDLRVVNRR